jgi:hypothetical protein
MKQIGEQSFKVKISQRYLRQYCRAPGKVCPINGKLKVSFHISEGERKQGRYHEAQARIPTVETVAFPLQIIRFETFIMGSKEHHSVLRNRLVT